MGQVPKGSIQGGEGFVPIIWPSCALWPWGTARFGIWYLAPRTRNRIIPLHAKWLRKANSLCIVPQRRGNTCILTRNHCPSPLELSNYQYLWGVSSLHAEEQSTPHQDIYLSFVVKPIRKRAVQTFKSGMKKLTEEALKTRWLGSYSIIV